VTEIEKAADAHGWKSAHLILHGWLRVEPLVLLSVHQVERAAVYRRESESAPLARADPAGKMSTDASVDVSEEGTGRSQVPHHLWINPTAF
jgi:hypothetical protein